MILKHLSFHNMNMIASMTSIIMEWYFEGQVQYGFCIVIAMVPPINAKSTALIRKYFFVLSIIDIFN